MAGAMARLQLFRRGPRVFRLALRYLRFSRLLLPVARTSVFHLRPPAARRADSVPVAFRFRPRPRAGSFQQPVKILHADRNNTVHVDFRNLD